MTTAKQKKYMREYNKRNKARIREQQDRKNQEKAQELTRLIFDATDDEYLTELKGMGLL